MTFVTTLCAHFGSIVEVLISAGADTLLHHFGEDTFSRPIMHPDELADHDGSGDKDGPYVAVLGAVYDMSTSANFYGPGGNYAMFAGRDATLNLARNSLDGNLPGADKEGVEGMTSNHGVDSV